MQKLKNAIKSATKYIAKSQCYLESSTEILELAIIAKRVIWKINAGKNVIIHRIKIMISLIIILIFDKIINANQQQQQQQQQQQ